MKFTQIHLLFSLTAMFVAVGNNTFAAAEADLLVAYDQTHSASVGGEDNAQVLAANAIAGSNGVNERSGTGARVRIVGYHQAAQNLYQTTSKGGFVNWMASYDSHMTDVVDAGNARGADLVAWLCVSTADGAAAVAQQPGRYSAFDPGQFWTAVVAHELGGHNYSCDHRGGRATPGQKTVMMHNYCDGGGATPPYFFSNPNTWLNGAKLIGETSCLGAAVDGGDNAYLISTTAQGVADRNARVVTAPNLGNVILRWCFTNSAAAAPAGTTIVDAVSGSNAVVRGVGATFTGKALRIPGGTTGNTAANSIAAYIDLPNGIISARTNLTIEIWATPLSAPNWARIADFGRTTEAGNGAAGEWTGLPGTPAPGSTSSSDDIMLSVSIGTDINQQRFEAKLNGTATTLDAGLATTAGVPHHYAITFADGAGAFGAAGGRWQWFRDGDAVAFLDVNYKLASIEDVNNWLGRSLWSGDAMANNDYAEVRISSVAMTRDEVFANYTLGPNHIASAVTLIADDAIGSASFAAAGSWSDGLAPSAGKTYDTYRFRLRTPADGTSRTFAGQALAINGGGITWKGTSSSSLTINNLTLSGSTEFIQAGSGTWTLAGILTVKSDEAMIRAANGPITLAASILGNGNLLCLNNTVTLSGGNANFQGKIIVGDGRFSGLSIDSEARLGTNPATFTADQLTLNRGILYSGNMTIDDANRGIRIGVSAGLFNVSPGTTLTLAVPLSSAASGNSLVTTPLYPNPASGILIKENTGTLVLTHPNNSHVGEIIINGGGFTIGGAGRLNNGDQAMPVVNNATMTFNSTAAQTISGVISGTGALVKNSTGILTLTAANTYTGSTTVSAGSLVVSGATAGGNVNVNGSGTLAGNGTLGGSTTIQSGGTLTPGNNGIGRLTVNNNVTLQTGGTTRLELNKAANTNDVLQISGTLTYGGTLTVTNLTGTLVLGDSFKLFNAANFTGSFAATNLPSLSPDLAWQFNPISGTLTVVSAIATNPINLTWFASGNNLTLSWPADHTGWRLQVQTNSLATGLNTNWFDVPGATTNNSITLPVDSNYGSMFYRLIFP